MTESLQRAIEQLKQLSDVEQDKIATMILKQIESKDKLSSLWQKIDDLGVDEEKPTMEEITLMVKEVRQSHN